jgi:hypothetical protein
MGYESVVPVNNSFLRIALGQEVEEKKQARVKHALVFLSVVDITPRK